MTDNMTSCQHFGVSIPHRPRNRMADLHKHVRVRLAQWWHGLLRGVCPPESTSARISTSVLVLHT
jgi:hypothetical protein